ncbi:MAG: hypothetical protein COA88_10335 [Kordia sp.]|nr:MAG: hypothetical protein COA88_10335 [Kordia sp.]
MAEYYLVFRKILVGIEFVAALVGFMYILKLKNSYWKYFSFYLFFIFLQEFLGVNNIPFFNIPKEYYYAFIGIPIQYLFWIWLYAYKSLKNKKLFVVFIIIYLSTYFPVELYYQKIDLVYSLNLTVGTILLMILIVLEFKKQIITDDILKFKENKMFYINIGVMLFYVGTYPYFTFRKILLEDVYIDIREFYYFYFLVSNYLMYLLFTASFIWGKQES